MPKPANANRLLIFGASVRAAAQSAAREGFQVIGADLFADVDARAAGDICTISDYPSEFDRLARDLPDAPWMYTGGLENHPALVQRISAGRPLLGNRAQELRKVRDPFLLANAYRSEGIPTVCTSPQPPIHDDGGLWLRKPCRSCNGSGIRRVSPSLAASCQDSFYYQQYVDGLPCSALFLGCGAQPYFLGSCQQLLEESVGSGEDFRFRGVCGPLPPDERLDEQWLRIGDCLVRHFGLKGLFGVDAVLDDGQLWPLEVNPRFTASVEIYERAFGIGLIGPHIRACQGLQPTSLEIPVPLESHGKYILYARHDFVMSRGMARQIEAKNSAEHYPRVSDLPEPGAKLLANQPIMTIFAKAKHASELPSILCREAKAWQQLFEQEFAEHVSKS